MKTKLPFIRNTGILLCCLFVSDAFAAGCVASRGAGMPNSALGFHKVDTALLDSESEHDASGVQTTIAFRAFRSDRHFSGTEEHKNRQAEGSEVINDSRFVDVSFAYEFDDFYSMSLTIPFAYHDRSQVVRDSDRNILQRFHTQSAGLGDVQIVGSRWMFDPKEASNGNIALGLGIDIPTGKEDTEDTFMSYDATTDQIVAQTRTVDQSIQLGDGGWGVIVDINAYYKFRPQLAGYFNGSYTITPEEKNGVPTFRSNPFESEMSIADTYLVRTGLDYLISPELNLVFSLGARLEGVAVNDLIGGSEGFRRPGYDLSIEPGISMAIDSWMFNLYVPVSVERNRQKSVPDQQLSAATGTDRHGDAAFADYSVTFAISKVF